MRLFNRPDRTGRLQKAFRTNFLFLISDGAYPPHRQQRLYSGVRKSDWIGRKPGHTLCQRRRHSSNGD